jgi:hypothetical protein
MSWGVRVGKGVFPPSGGDFLFSRGLRGDDYEVEMEAIVSRSWRRRLVVLALTATMVGVVGVSPALATWTPGAPSSPGNVTPTVVVAGTCSKVGSLGSQFKVSKLYVDKAYVISGGPTITIDASPDKKSFSWTISPGFQVHDVTVLGLFTPFNHYDYGETPLNADGSLHAPLIGTSSTILGFGYFCWSPVETETFSISGKKVHDQNANGVEDDESGLSGWTIQLSQGETFIGDEVTGEGGLYSFSGLEAGEYQVCEVLQDGWVQTSPGGCHSVAVGPLDATGVDFLNSEGVDMCEEDASTPEGDTSATFTLVGECGEGQTKVAAVAVEGDEIVFIPTGDGTAQYEGTLTFSKLFSDPDLLILMYNPDPDGEVFTPVPACAGANQLPDTGDNWCYFGVDLTPVGDGAYDVTWQVFGVDDPRFK